MRKPKPIVVHIRALVACFVLLGIACGWSWIFPFSTLHFIRVDANRVDCLIKQHVIGVIAFRKIEVIGVQRTSLSREAAHRGASGRYFFALEGADGNHTLVSASGYSDGIVKQVDTFLNDPSQKNLRLWVMSLFGYATVVVALPAVLLTIAVLWDFVVNRIAWITYAPERFVSEQSPSSNTATPDGEIE